MKVQHTLLQKWGQLTNFYAVLTEHVTMQHVTIHREAKSAMLWDWVQGMKLFETVENFFSTNKNKGPGTGRSSNSTGEYAYFEMKEVL